MANTSTYNLLSSNWTQEIKTLYSKYFAFLSKVMHDRNLSFKYIVVLHLGCGFVLVYTTLHNKNQCIRKNWGIYLLIALIVSYFIEINIKSKTKQSQPAAEIMVHNFFHPFQI